MAGSLQLRSTGSPSVSAFNVGPTNGPADGRPKLRALPTKEPARLDIARDVQFEQEVPGDSDRVFVAKPRAVRKVQEAGQYFICTELQS